MLFYINCVFILQKPAVKTTVGLLECPLGNTRLHVAKLLSALLSTENLKIHETLANMGTFQTLLVRLYDVYYFPIIKFPLFHYFLFSYLYSELIGSVFQIYME